MTKQVLERIFFGKDNAFKLNFTSKGETYFQLGVKKDEGWSWKKVKMNDMELGKIINVLENKTAKASFYHEFEGERTQIWVNRKDKFVFIRIGDNSKGLNAGEQTVLRELLKYAVLRTNMIL